MRVIAGVVLVARHAGRAELIGPRVKNEPHQVLQVELVLDQFAQQVPHQRLIRGGVARPQIVDRFDQPHAQIMPPNAIDNRAGEGVVLRIGDPGGQLTAGSTVGSIFVGVRSSGCGSMNLPVRGWPTPIFWSALSGVNERIEPPCCGCLPSSLTGAK